jgi:predicted nucleic acid-binding protein
MGRADGWFMCRVGYLETARAIGLAGSPSAVRSVQKEWAAFSVIEVDQDLVERATGLALAHELRSLDALHLAAALVLPREDLTVAVWDRRLHAAARAEGLGLFPETLGGPVRRCGPVRGRSVAGVR